jgi:hypothetical protein
MLNMLAIIGQFILGLVYANLGEWLMHRYILHGLGRDPQSFWAYHWHEHHAVCLKHNMIDPGYQRLDFCSWNIQTKELAALAAIIMGHMPLFLLSPIFAVALYTSLALYYYRHRKAHLDSEWARQHLRWHYEHHLCGTRPANWCVTWPWCDYLLGTRVKSNLPSCHDVG